MDMTPIRILLADDHAIVRDGLRALIEKQSDMVVVAEAADGRECVRVAEEHSPDIVMMDIAMPNMNGMEATRRILAANPRCAVVILSMHQDESYVLGSLKAGAKGYLLKDAQREDLLECIRKVHAGETSIPPALVAKLAAGMSNETLTGRELEVLSLLSRGKSNKEIGVNLYISETTVKSHLRSIFSKLNVLSRTEAIAAASRRGLVQI